MPTKRPDQLPSGQNFDFDDILMIEKNPDGSDRELNKATIREFMKSATQLDPERVAESPILGLQSAFEWIVEQINILAVDPVSPVSPYENFDSPNKDSEQAFITPTPTPTQSSTPAPTTTPFKTPTPTPTATPTPSKQPLPKRTQITLNGPLPQIVSLPTQYLPEARGYQSWRIIGGQDSSSTSLTNFFGYFPDSFTASALSEVLIVINKIDEGHIKISSGVEDDDDAIQLLGGLFDEASITFTIDYS